MTLYKVTIPKGAHVLLLEDSDMRIEWFKRQLSHLHVVKSVADFIAYFETRPIVDFIFLDHDLGDGGSGYDAAKYVHDNFGGNSRWGLIHSRRSS